MYTVENKFEIGETCYTHYRKPVHYKCPICEGNGKFMHNGYEICCKNCNGTGKLHNAHQTVAEPCEVKIRSIKATMNSDGVTTISYAVTPIEPFIQIKKRSEVWLFKDKDECIENCKAINQQSAQQ